MLSNASESNSGHKGIIFSNKIIISINNSSRLPLEIHKYDNGFPEHSSSRSDKSFALQIGDNARDIVRTTILSRTFGYLS
jgi:hypothetical protein